MVKKSKSNSPQHSHYIAIVAIVAVVAVVILVMNSMKTSMPVEDMVMEEVDSGELIVQEVMEESDGALVGQAGSRLRRGLRCRHDSQCHDPYNPNIDLICRQRYRSSSKTWIGGVNDKVCHWRITDGPCKRNEDCKTGVCLKYGSEDDGRCDITVKRSRDEREWPIGQVCDIISQQRRYTFDKVVWIQNHGNSIGKTAKVFFYEPNQVQPGATHTFTRRSKNVRIKGHTFGYNPWSDDGHDCVARPAKAPVGGGSYFVFSCPNNRRADNYLLNIRNCKECFNLKGHPKDCFAGGLEK